VAPEILPGVHVPVTTPIKTVVAIWPVRAAQLLAEPGMSVRGLTRQAARGLMEGEGVQPFMTPIQDLLHRIQWDPQFGQGRFVVGYYDRVRGGIVRVPFQRLSFHSGDRFSFDLVAEDGSARMVPLHRVREVWRNGQLIWQRTVV
jgi:uncharacterized protein (UPF0248 family)